jgi:Flp pilus assembly protein TadG
MKRPVISKSEIRLGSRGHKERGVTLVLVAAAMVAILAMAALSIDVVTLYLANAEAQRAADAAALSAARILSISGMTGDPTNANTGAGTNAWQSACQLATQVATSVAQQNTVGGLAVPTGQITVTYPNNSDTALCSGTSLAFGVNPLVTVKVQRTNLPTFFSRIWGNKSAQVSGTATAEAYNSSASQINGNGGAGGLIPVQPRCVKPWLIPNNDPNGGLFVAAADGEIQNSGIQVPGGSNNGVIGEHLNLKADCNLGAPNCAGANLTNPTPIGGEYIPALVNNAAVAVKASCAVGDNYQSAIAGCDQTTIYQCGVPGGNYADLTINPMIPTPATGETAVAASCLINQTAGGRDALDTTIYPYQIRAGFGNTLVAAGVVNTDDIITTSDSIATLPIFNAQALNGLGTNPQITVVGFLQVFIDVIGSGAGPNGGNIQAWVLNVSGCGDGTTTPGPAVNGSSPVPVRLVTAYP